MKRRDLNTHWLASARAIAVALVAPAILATGVNPAHAQATGAGASTAAGAKAAVRAQHGDWQVVCKKPTGARVEVCAVVQDVTSESNPNVGLSVHLQTAPDGQTSLRVFAPLGILLPPGLGLQIDNAKVGHAPFVRCHVIGCMAQVTLDTELLAKLHAGKTAWFIVFQTKEAGIGIPVSLKGLPEAIAALSK